MAVAQVSPQRIPYFLSTLEQTKLVFGARLRLSNAYLHRGQRCLACPGEFCS